MLIQVSNPLHILPSISPLVMYDLHLISYDTMKRAIKAYTRKRLTDIKYDQGCNNTPCAPVQSKIIVPCLNIVLLVTVVVSVMII